MSARAIPNLYLKWRAFREIVGLNRSDAVIAEKFFGAGEGPIKFSKLLRGDYGCGTDLANYIADVVNEAVAAHRKRAGLTGASPITIRGTDLSAPLYEFTRRMVEAIETTDEESLDRAHAALLEEMTLPAPRLDQDSKLRIEQYSRSRMFAGFEPSGGSGPVVFRPDLHMGRLVVEGLARKPEAAYALITRDPAPVAKRLWEMEWGETVMWLPSPFVPSGEGGGYPLMPDPQPVANVPGRFTVTAALVHNPDLVRTLDPRGASPRPQALDEADTARFLTNLRRVTDTRSKSRHNRGDITVVSGVYLVEA